MLIDRTKPIVKPIDYNLTKNLKYLVDAIKAEEKSNPSKDSILLKVLRENDYDKEIVSSKMGISKKSLIRYMYEYDLIKLKYKTGITKDDILKALDENGHDKRIVMNTLGLSYGSLKYYMYKYKIKTLVRLGISGRKYPKDILLKELEKNGHNREATAKALGISPLQLYNRMYRNNIKIKDSKRATKYPKDILLKELEKNGHNREVTAKVLGISPKQLYRQMYRKNIKIRDSKTLPKYTKDDIMKALDENGHDKNVVMSKLGICYNTMKNYMSKYKIKTLVRSGISGRTPKYTKDDIMKALDENGHDKNVVMIKLGISYNMLRKYMHRYKIKTLVRFSKNGRKPIPKKVSYLN